MSRALSRAVLERLDYETPFFLFSRKKIVAALRHFEECFPSAAIHYAMKANSEPEILRTLADAGSNFEAASAYELAMLKALHVPAGKIIYGTAVKPASHIKAFHEYGVDRFAFDSLPELEKIASVAPGARAYLRVAVDETGSVFRFSEKFGAHEKDIPALMQHARRLGLRPYGISFHVGSQASNPRAWANALKLLAPWVQELRDAGNRVEVINLGGGYPCAYAGKRPNIPLEEIACHIFAEYRRLPEQPKLILEPGRGIIANSAVLVASVIARVERAGVTWLFLDGGAYNALFETLACQGSTQYDITLLGSSDVCERVRYSIAGPTGDSLDVIARDVLLPINIKVGDRLAVHAVGAYSIGVAGQFNGFPKPNIWLMD